MLKKYIKIENANDICHIHNNKIFMHLNHEKYNLFIDYSRQSLNKPIYRKCDISVYQIYNANYNFHNFIFKIVLIMIFLNSIVNIVIGFYSIIITYIFIFSFSLLLYIYNIKRYILVDINRYIYIFKLYNCCSCIEIIPPEDIYITQQQSHDTIYYIYRQSRKRKYINSILRIIYNLYRT